MTKISAHPAWNTAATEASGTCEARWKLLGGEGFEQVFRAICGRERSCPTSLGRLTHFDPFSVYAERIRALTEYFHELHDSGDKNAVTHQWAEFQAWVDQRLGAVYRARLQADQGGNGPRWMMVAEQLDPNRRLAWANYYGHPDSGYRISFNMMSRRPAVPHDPILRELIEEGGLHKWAPSGHWPTPPCQIWCPTCGTLNYLPVPEGVVIAPYRVEQRSS